jgi:(heptosyl)LPS beta-1,4-glucosyltransferase
MVPRISVVVNTLNEEENLPYALRSVCSWADEMVVVDMHSDDRTAEVAAELGARVHLHERTGVVEAARNHAISLATGDWILLLDADELIPRPLSRRLREIASDDLADVVVVSRLNYLLGAPLLHTGWGPEQDRHARFFRRGCLVASETIHRPPESVAGARVVTLPYRPDEAIVHFSYLDSAHFIERLNRYTSVEALQARARGEGTTTWGTAWRAGREFAARYFRHGGYRDGWRGLYLSLFMAFYRAARDAKLVELERVGEREEIRGRYREEARRVIGQYAEEAEEPAGRITNHE